MSLASFRSCSRLGSSGRGTVVTRPPFMSLLSAAPGRKEGSPTTSVRVVLLGWAQPCPRTGGVPHARPDIRPELAVSEAAAGTGHNRSPGVGSHATRPKDLT